MCCLRDLQYTKANKLMKLSINIFNKNLRSIFRKRHFKNIISVLATTNSIYYYKFIMFY